MNGDLSPGSQLPAVWRLAKLYGVSVPTMHAALQCLVAIGFVRATQGVGTFVTDARSEATVLIHAWREASNTELALMRSAIDERMPALAARAWAGGKSSRPPSAIFDIDLMAHERSMLRYADPESFVDANITFHETIARSVRGAEVLAACYRPISLRLMPALVTAGADAPTGDDTDSAHLRLARAIIDGRPADAARLARAIARHERGAIAGALG